MRHTHTDCISSYIHIYTCVKPSRTAAASLLSGLIADRYTAMRAPGPKDTTSSTCTQAAGRRVLPSSPTHPRTPSSGVSRKKKISPFTRLLSLSRARQKRLQPAERKNRRPASKPRRYITREREPIGREPLASRASYVSAHGCARDYGSERTRACAAAAATHTKCRRGFYVRSPPPPPSPVCGSPDRVQHEPLARDKAKSGERGRRERECITGESSARASIAQVSRCTKKEPAARCTARRCIYREKR